MKPLREFQFGMIIFLFALPAQIFLAIAYKFQLGNNPPSFNSLLVANGVIILVYLLFYGMTTTIDNKQIRITYGIGLIRKSIPLADIKSVSIVSNPWYYGWGIRLIPNGMLYNIRGTSGVELEFNNSSRIIRIGSGDASALRNAILTSLK